MNLTVFPRKLSGSIQAIPSKSQAHRLLICSAFADAPTHLICPQINQDIEATADCLQAIGAQITRTCDGYDIQPVRQLPQEAVLPCRESGSTLRFMLPIIGALGIRGTFLTEGRLFQRPLSPLWEEMQRMGCSLLRRDDQSILCTGQLKSGRYCIRGDISSQFITGLLYAMALLPGQSELCIEGQLQSAPYVHMTQSALSCFGVSFDGLQISGGGPFHSPGQLRVEGDWSNGAFFLAASALGSSLQVQNLDPESLQGDKAAAQLLHALETHCTIDAADIPDLIPVLSVVAAAKSGAVFKNVQRLRMKESDRVASILHMLRALGIRAESDVSTLTVYPGQFTGGTVDSENDHRIAMSAAVAATVANGPVTILNAQCVAKSYPSFWEAYGRLGGHYEQHLR